MRVALVDDDKEQIEYLAELVSTELSSIGDTEHKITTYSSGEVFLNEWNEEEFDLIVLDIFMESLTGIDVARRIRETDENVRIAFCTSSNEFASESYEVNAAYYLQKPITADSVKIMFKRLNLEIIDYTRTIKLSDGHTLMLRNILYTEYNNHVVTIHIKDEEPYKLRTSQGEMEALLFPHGYFYSPFKGIIVNFYEIEKLTEDSFILKDGKAQPISRRKYKEAKDAYTKFRFNKIRKEVDW